MNIGILFFTCFNTRSITLESTIIYFKKKNYNVHLITTCKKGPLHTELEKQGVITHEFVNKKRFNFIYYIQLIGYLKKYINKNNVKVVHSHLQIPNFICSLTSYFTPAIIFTVRHNSDVIRLNGNYKEKLTEKIINKLSRHIIAISKKVKEELIRENVSIKKIHRVNNGYDFLEYEKLSLGTDYSTSIKNKYGGDMLILSPGRLIKTKRHELTIEAINTLNHTFGHNTRLLILGDGPEYNKLQSLITEKNLNDCVFIEKYHENISDFIKAADIIALLSESEASNNTIKEAGYFEKPVAICKGVGDFDDYIEHKISGIFLSKEKPVNEFVSYIQGLYKNPSPYTEMGKSLKQKVVENFDIHFVGLEYEKLQKKLLNK